LIRIQKYRYPLSWRAIADWLIVVVLLLGTRGFLAYAKYICKDQLSSPPV